MIFTHHYFQLQHINRFYNENTKGKYTPRFIPVDLDSTTIDSSRTDNYGKLFSIDNCVVDRFGTGNNWAKGRYPLGLDLMPSIKDVVRKEVERCECLHAFQINSFIRWGNWFGFRNCFNFIP